MFLEGGNLLVFYYLSSKGLRVMALWWEGPYKKGTTVAVFIINITMFMVKCSHTESCCPVGLSNSTVLHMIGRSVVNERLPGMTPYEIFFDVYC